MKLRIYLALLFSSVFVSATWAQVQFSQPHGLYEVDELIVSIIPSEEGLEIRYTTDGSAPTMERACYTEQLKLTKTTLLRACEVWDDATLSPVTSASYIFMESVMSQPNNPEGYPSEWGKYNQISGRAIADYEMDPEMTNDAELRPKIMH